MNVLNAYKLLTLAAEEYHKEKDAVSREEIVKRINEIKYLAAQKKLPRLSLRKEMVHLEHQLHSLLDMDKTLLSQKKRESSKVKALKEQLAGMRRRLAAVEDKDLQKKVERLAHLLGECVARLQTKEDVALQETIARELQRREAGKQEARQEEKAVPFTGVTRTPAAGVLSRVRRLETRISSLQKELALQKARGKESEELKQVEQHIRQLQEKVRAFYEEHPQALKKEETIGQTRVQEQKRLETGKDLPAIEKPKIKHIVLFGGGEQKEAEREKKSGETENEEEKELVQEFPLPPPPKGSA